MRKSLKVLVVQVLSISLGLGAAIAVGPSASAHSASGYCAAVRGNGQSMPAHWGAMAKMMETYGAPVGIAGGSSASVTAFWWESMAINPLLRGDNSWVQGRKMALLFKALEGLTVHFTDKPQWQALAGWIKGLSTLKTDQLLAALSADGMQNLEQSVPELKSALADLHQSRIFNGPAVQALWSLIVDPELPTSSLKQSLLRLRLNALKETLSVFGKFDAKNDGPLFFRPGVVDFPHLAEQFAVIADFLSLRSADPAMQSQLGQFFDRCLPLSQNRTWAQLVALAPNCQSTFNDAFDAYFKHYKLSSESRLFEKVGAYRKVLVGTALLKGESAQRYRDVRARYEETFDNSLAAQFSAAQKDIGFGYFASAKDLKRIQTYRREVRDELTQLDKTKRFMAIEEANWLQALSTSPAEPGLAAGVDLESVGLRSDDISLGGWSDLSPVPVLKMAGCAKVVYVQRRGGDTLFATGVAKRLFDDFDYPSWDLLDGGGEGAQQSLLLNNVGRRDDVSSRWGQMFNVANPRSSYAASISNADAVICTDWNRFDVTKDFVELVNTSYDAPIFQGGRLNRSAQAKAQFIDRSQNEIDKNLGYSPFVGCIPLAP